MRSINKSMKYVFGLIAVVAPAATLFWLLSIGRDPIISVLIACALSVGILLLFNVIAARVAWEKITAGTLADIVALFVP
jgi:hypothetical protein